MGNLLRPIRALATSSFFGFVHSCRYEIRLSFFATDKYISPMSLHTKGIAFRSIPVSIGN
jgi:hypothetical protein